MLANRHVMGPYAACGRGPVSLRHVRAYRPGDRPATRFAAMNAGRVLPGALRTRFRRRPLSGDGACAARCAASRAWSRCSMSSTTSCLRCSRVLERRLRALGVRRRGARGGPRADDLRARAAGDHRARRRAGRPRVVDPAGRRSRALLASGRGPPDRPGLPERYVLYPANMWPHKNHARLLDAFAAVDDPELWLVLTGQTYGRERLLAGRARVRHLGHVPAGDLAGLYRGAAGGRLPEPVRGLRPAAAGGDGLRGAGRRVGARLARRGLRGRGAAVRSRGSRRDRRRDPPGDVRRGLARAVARGRAGAGGGLYVGGGGAASCRGLRARVRARARRGPPARRARTGRRRRPERRGRAASAAGAGSARSGRRRASRGRRCARGATSTSSSRAPAGSGGARPRPARRRRASRPRAPRRRARSPPWPAASRACGRATRRTAGPGRARDPARSSCR